MYSQENAQKWLTEIRDQQEEINNKKINLIQKRDFLFMKLELLTKVRHQLRTDILERYHNELEKLELEIKSLNDLAYDLKLLKDMVEGQLPLVRN